MRHALKFVNRVKITGPIESLEPRTLFSAGSLDPSFGNGGELAVSFPGGQTITVVRDSLVQPDGKIVVVGQAIDPTGPNMTDFALARLNPDGTPDTAFNNGAGIYVFHSAGNADDGTGVALQSDGKIVVSATFEETRTDQTDYGIFAVGRFNADGTLDTGFGDQGAIAVNFNTTGTNAQAAAAHDVLVGPDDKITVVGYAAPDPAQSTSDIALARFNADGTADTTFGTGGKVLTQVRTGVAGDSELGESSAFDASGDIIVTGTAGTTINGTVTQFLTTRFLPTGAVDTTFGTGGYVTTNFAAPTDIGALAVGDAAAVQPDGGIVVGGLVAHIDASANITGHFALARYNADGTPDATFGTNGLVESNLAPVESINKLLIDPQGRIIASGLEAADAADAGNLLFNPSSPSTRPTAPWTRPSATAGPSSSPSTPPRRLPESPRPTRPRRPPPTCCAPRPTPPSASRPPTPARRSRCNPRWPTSRPSWSHWAASCWSSLLRRVTS